MLVWIDSRVWFSSAHIHVFCRTAGGHIFGLRSNKQFGKSNSLGVAESICEKTYEISDEEAYRTMVDLWNVGIPASPSGGGYIAGALRLAGDLKKKGREGTIVTLIFDSLELYEGILTLWMPRILKHNLVPLRETFSNLRESVKKEREKHLASIKNKSLLTKLKKTV